MKKKIKNKPPKIIFEITIHGNKVIFTEDSKGIVEHWIVNRLTLEEFDAITRYLIDEGIFESICGKEYINSILEETD